MEKIKINFVKSSEDGTYSLSDAIHLPANHSYTDDEIEAMKQSRFDKWLYMILNPLDPNDQPAAEEPAPVFDVSVVEEPSLISEEIILEQQEIIVGN